jgi:hypothetical protein
MAITGMTLDIERQLMDWIIDEWRLAGHSLSGSFEKSLTAETTMLEDGVKIDVVGNEYGIYMNAGVKPENIPYTRRNRGEGKGGTSKYITGLKNYVQRRMGISDEKEALGIAFAIANKHKEEGIIGSGFLRSVADKHMDRLTELVEDYYSIIIEKSWQ